MLERYVTWRYNLEIAVLIAGGIAAFVWLFCILYALWKNRRDK